MNIRKASREDLSRIGEIYVFNNRANYYPVFKDKIYSFSKLQVISIIDEYFKFDEVLESIYVFDDGLVSAFMEIKETEICKLYVDPFFQNSGIGSELIEFAINFFILSVIPVKVQFKSLFCLLKIHAKRLPLSLFISFLYRTCN